MATADCNMKVDVNYRVDVYFHFDPDLSAIGKV